MNEDIINMRFLAIESELRELAQNQGRTWSPFYNEIKPAPYAIKPVGSLSAEENQSLTGLNVVHPMIPAPAHWITGTEVQRKGLSTTTKIQSINGDRTLITVEMDDNGEKKTIQAPANDFTEPTKNK